MKPFAEKFYKSMAWRNCRDAYFISQHGICERCGDAGKIVHHTVELTPENINDPEITLNWELLELVCESCHNKQHHGSGEGVTREDVAFNEYGELIKR